MYDNAAAFREKSLDALRFKELGQDSKREGAPLVGDVSVTKLQPKNKRGGKTNLPRPLSYLFPYLSTPCLDR